MRIFGALNRRRANAMRRFQYRPDSRKLRDAVLFEAFAGKVVGDSPLDIFHEVKRRYPELELVWTVDDQTSAPAGARAVRFGSGDWLRALATSKYLVNNTNFPNYFRKLPEQIYLQTWHGTPLKRLGRDIATNYLSKSYLDTMDREANYWNYLISPSKFCTEIFPGAFGYSGNILETGYPRNDRLSKITGAERQQIRERIGVSDPSTVLVLYAPTWRDYARSATGNWETVNYLDENIELPAGFQMLYRGHSNTHAMHNNSVAGQAIDVTMYPDITELYIAADVLITDFSSVMFDYTVTGKPIMFLAPDLERYRAERGFYFDFEALAPVPILSTDVEVLHWLGHLDQLSRDFPARYRSWQQKFDALEDGNAAARVVDAVWGKR